MNPRSTAVLILLGVNLVWGSTFFLTKRSLEAFGNDWAGWLALRFLVASAAALIAFAPRLGALASPSIWRDALWISLPTWTGFAFQTAGMAEVSPGTSAFLTSLYVPCTPLAAWILFRQRPPATLLVALGAALAGLWLVTAPGGGGAGPGRGELLSAACGFAFAFQIVLVSRLAPRHDPGALTAAMTLLQGLAFLVAAGGSLPWRKALAEPWAWGPILYMGTAVNVFTFWAMNRFQPRLEASHAALVYALEPVFAGAFSALCFGERFGIQALIGGTLVVAANVWAGQAVLKPPPAPDRIPPP